MSPQVTIRIEGEGRAKEYKLPKGLLCKQSPYFAAMFEEGRFREGEEQSAVLTEMEGVVSVRSFETLLQYLFLGNIVQKSELIPEEVDHIIEFTRLADMCRVTGMEKNMADRLRAIIVAHSRCYQEPADGGWGNNIAEPQDLAGQSEDEFLVVTIERINAAANLPFGNPVRRVLAETAVRDFFLCERIQFWKDVCQDVPSFASDLMIASQKAMGSVHNELTLSHFIDPINRRKTFFGTCCETSHGGWGCLCAVQAQNNSGWD